MERKVELIPAKDTVVTMPSTICVQYAAEIEEITESTVQELIEDIRNGKCQHVYLSLDPNGEDQYLQMESENGWIFIQYGENIGLQNETWYSTYNAEYANSDEEAPILCSDGQSIIEKRYTMHDLALAVKCIAYFIRTGQLYPGMEWAKSWSA